MCTFLCPSKHHAYPRTLLACGFRRSKAQDRWPAKQRNLSRFIIGNPGIRLPRPRARLPTTGAAVKKLRATSACAVRALGYDGFSFPSVSQRTATSFPWRQTPLPSAHRHASRGRLINTLGVGFGIAVAIGNTIGAGIVRTPGEIAALLPSTWLYFAAWATGGIYMSLGALQFAELGALLAAKWRAIQFRACRAGRLCGIHRRLERLDFHRGKFCRRLDRFCRIHQRSDSGAHGHVRPLAAGVILVFALLQWKSMKVGSGVQDLTTILKALLFLAVVAVCFFHTRRQ